MQPQAIQHRLFGSDEDRVQSVGGVGVETEDWGGWALHHPSC